MNCHTRSSEKLKWKVSRECVYAHTQLTEIGWPDFASRDLLWLELQSKEFEIIA